MMGRPADIQSFASSQRCVEAVRQQLRLGDDGVILHGASPAELDCVVAA